jgi:hypothetical protein
LIYSLKEGEFSKTPIRVNDNWVIVGINKKTDADMSGLAVQRDTLKQSMITERQVQLFEDYIAGVEERMRREGRIEIYDSVLNELDESEPRITRIYADHEFDPRKYA